MIIVRLAGGLGNQMFQYAFGRSLAERKKIVFKIDNTGYVSAVGDPKLGIRLFGLNHFNIEAPYAGGDELKIVQAYRHNRVYRKILHMCNRITSYSNRKYIVEPQKNYFHFDAGVYDREYSEDVYFDGYWQSESYFKECEEVIRKEFEFKNSPDKINTEFLIKIGESNSVAVHVRHGDNATSAAKKHGVLSLEYYKKAIEGISEKIKNPTFFIFSDDVKWAKENIKFDYPYFFVDHNGDDKNYEDIRLMSACKHHIIGNSTFSWWGAWLGKKKNQIVFAPKYYHVDVDISNSDYYPKDWIVI